MPKLGPSYKDRVRALWQDFRCGTHAQAAAVLSSPKTVSSVESTGVLPQNGSGDCCCGRWDERLEASDPGLEEPKCGRERAPYHPPGDIVGRSRGCYSEVFGM